MNGTRSTASWMQMTLRRDGTKSRSRAGCLLVGTLGPSDTILNIPTGFAPPLVPWKPTPGPQAGSPIGCGIRARTLRSGL